MKALVFIVAAGLLASVEAWPEARIYDYEGKLQKYLDKIAEIKKGNICMWMYCYL